MGDLDTNRALRVGEQVLARDELGNSLHVRIIEVGPFTFSCRAVKEDGSFRKKGEQVIVLPMDSVTEFLDPEELTSREKRKIVESLLREDVVKGADRKFANFQLGVFNKLLEKYPSCSFWRFWDPGFKVRNLTWYLGEDGEEILKEQYQLFAFDIPKGKDYLIENESTEKCIKNEDTSSLLSGILKDNPSKPRNLIEYFNS